MPEREHIALFEQMLESGLSADFRNEYLALWGAAEAGDRALFVSFMRNLLSADRSAHGPLRTYDERFSTEPAVLTATNQEVKNQLDDVVQRMNALLAQPVTTNLRQFAGLCQEADDLILGPAALPRAA